MKDKMFEEFNNLFRLISDQKKEIDELRKKVDADDGSSSSSDEATDDLKKIRE